LQDYLLKKKTFRIRQYFNFLYTIQLLQIFMCNVIGLTHVGRKTETL